MPSRLLSLLASIEYALKLNESPAVALTPERFVSYQRGLARMSFKDRSGSLALQSFTLADGQICLKAEFYWLPLKATGTCSIYPTGENFDWTRASEKIAEAWLAGPDEAALAAVSSATESLPAAS